MCEDLHPHLAGLTASDCWVVLWLSVDIVSSVESGTKYGGGAEADL